MRLRYEKIPDDVKVFAALRYEEGNSFRAVTLMVKDEFGLVVSRPAITRMLREAGVPARPVRHNGTRRSVHSDGHVRLYVGKQDERASKAGYVMEHRVVMEDVLGRKLRDDEHVHHRDGVPYNNDPENLMVVSKSLHVWIHQVLRSLEKEAKAQYVTMTGYPYRKDVPLKMFWPSWHNVYIDPFIGFLRDLESGASADVVLAQIHEVERRLIDKSEQHEEAS